MSRDFSDFTISECDAVVEKYGLADFDTYINRDFPRFNEAERLAVLTQWDSMLENSKPSRETADHIARKRLLDSVHFALKRIGK